MITDEDRKEVARKLRFSAGTALHMNTSDDFAREVFRAAMNEEVVDYRAAIKRLADLIEPEPERTCRMVSAFDTDELEGIQENISFSPEDTLAYRCEGCGFDFRYERGLYPSYCPNCGARVTEND